MKTETLKELGLTDEQISAIMKENGKDIAKEQAKVTAIEAERDNYKGQLDTATETLKSFDGVDVAGMKQNIADLTDKLSKQESEYQDKLSGMQFDSTLEAAITAAGGKNAKVVKALLDIDTLKASKNQESDIKAALEACKSENGYVFGVTEPITNPVAPTNVPGSPTPESSLMSSMKSIMGISE